MYYVCMAACSAACRDDAIRFCVGLAARFVPCAAAASEKSNIVENSA
jgi:hypothetical protein